MLMATKLGRMVTYLKGILTINSYNSGLETSRDSTYDL